LPDVGATYQNEGNIPNDHNMYQEGFPDFSWYTIPKPDKMYQMNTKWPLNIPNVSKIFQMAMN
jgi:hypothetical protein